MNRICITYILITNCIFYLKSINVAKSVLHMAVHHKLAQTKNFTAQMERVSESGLFTLLCREGLDRLQVEVVVQVQVVQVLSVNQQVQHVVPLPAHLETDLYPV